MIVNITDFAHLIWLYGWILKDDLYLRGEEIIRVIVKKILFCKGEKLIGY